MGLCCYSVADCSSTVFQACWFAFSFLLQSQIQFIFFKIHQLFVSRDVVCFSQWWRFMASKREDRIVSWPLDLG